MTKHGGDIPNPYLDDPNVNVVTDNVPVVPAGNTAPPYIALGGIATTLLLWALNHFAAPLSSEQFAVVISAVNIIIGFCIAVWNRYYNNKVTQTSLKPHMQMRVVKE